MSADYWTSSQRKQWQFTRESLKTTRKELKLLQRSLEETGTISRAPIEYNIFMRIYIHSLINKLGRRLAIRQVALSTAEVYLMRFLTRVSLKEINIYLLVTTSIYLACKLEECPQHIRTINAEARNLWPEYIPHDATKVAEFEFYLIEELDTYLIVHHPYKSLLTMDEVLLRFNQRLNSGSGNINSPMNIMSSSATSAIPESTAPTGSKQTYALTPEELQTCWSIINDSYVTDLPLLYPPHIVASAAIYLTIVLKHTHIQQLRQNALNSQAQNLGATNSASHVAALNNLNNAIKSETHQNYINFLGRSNIDIEEVVEAVQEMITLYEAWESYDESKCRKTLEVILLNRSV
ncbi:hypothetical protein WICPIJ_009174 [Wickerhamomyces pijperi]|uniref:Cyclin-like domain-containing protein n=1 Tax=Wickerhamomyces pijperi TaxID=599730 RepID=A0A9P8PRY5_WICPI|nr:hypothetical protein WICPIJ_009174 [Wickerhamomyces pijperi]